MTRRTTRILEASVLALLLILFVVTLLISRSDRDRRYCRGIDVIIRDSSAGPVVSSDEIGRILRRSGFGQGMLMDSLDLYRIEQILSRESSVRSVEAYTTPDAILHIAIDQRVPVVRFQSTEGGFYADENAYIIPLGERYVSRVPLISGTLPFHVPAGHIGPLTDAAAQVQLKGYIELVLSLGRDPFWSKNVASISLENELGLVIRPMEGGERFILGSATDIPSKIERMTRYYTAILPYRENKAYRSVDLRFAGQIVCKK